MAESGATCGLGTSGLLPRKTSARAEAALPVACPEAAGSGSTCTHGAPGPLGPVSLLQVHRARVRRGGVGGGGLQSPASTLCPEEALGPRESQAASPAQGLLNAGGTGPSWPHCLLVPQPHPMTQGRGRPGVDRPAAPSGRGGVEWLPGNTETTPQRARMTQRVGDEARTVPGLPTGVWPRASPPGLSSCPPSGGSQAALPAKTPRGSPTRVPATPHLQLPGT